MSYLTLVNVQFPGNAFIIFKEILFLITYEVIPTEKLFPLFMELPDKGSFNEKFERVDFGSFYTLMNMGCICIVFLKLIFLQAF